MKMNKLLTLGVIAPMFAMCTSCAKGMSKISYKQALDFAVKHYDEYEYLGFSPTYIVRLNKLALNDTKAYAKVTKGDIETFEETYYIDTTVRDLSTTIDTDEIKLPHINSTVINELQTYLAMINGLIGYFDATFTLEDDKYLGVYAKSNKLEQVLSLAGLVAPMIGGLSTDIPKSIATILETIAELRGLTSSYASLKLTASCNNIGLLDRARLTVNIQDLSFSLSPDASESIVLALDVFIAKQIALDLELIVDYSNK